MSVYKKLMDARIRLQNTKLTKSGHNKFAGYQYFELGDFLPQTMAIFNELGLAGVITFSTEYAKLTIVDVDKPDDKIEFTSPMAEAMLKGCHPIQNLGAVQTYERRYLWVAAMEMVEHDALDATTGQEGKGKGVHKPTDNPSFTPDEEEVKYLSGIVDMVLSKETDYASSSEYLAGQNLDSDEKTWVWDKLDSKTRSGIKKYNAELKQKEGV